MAIDLVQFNQILAANVKGAALSAGYPDLLVRMSDLPEMGITFPPRKDSPLIEQHHSWKYPIADTQDVFNAMGLTLDVVDRQVIQGCERVVNLNNSMDPSWAATWFNDTGTLYDLVIDPGTSEHCFNIPQALANLASAVAMGGCISQALPMAMFNHGYWNVNPVALLDFYEHNGFKVEQCVIRHSQGIYEPVTRDRYKEVPDGSVTCLLARRMEKKPFTWPQQQSPSAPRPQ